MSEVKVNKISPRSGTGVQLGDSGDNITIPAGATINNQGTATNFGATGSASWTTTVKTADFTAVAGEGYFVNTTSGSKTVTLPAGVAGAVVAFKDYAGTFDTNVLVLTANGSDKIGGSTDDKQLGTEGIAATLIFIDSTQGWLVTDDGLQSTAGPLTYSADFLVIAGGGGGGSVGGGGIGGTSGAGAAAGFRGNGTNGVNSSISGSNITTITSVGGGSGTAIEGTGGSGGSGGGAGSGSPAGSAGSGTANQGFNGGGSGGGNAGGGGGGASAAGSAASGETGGAGGNGLASAITGSSVTRGGGGGGGVYDNRSSVGAGGSGGGGAGGNNSASYAGGAGTANTGGGGGGGGSAGGGAGAGGAGGSGVVILSMPDANYSGTTTGSPTVATGVSGKTVLTFTGDGSYTA